MTTVPDYDALEALEKRLQGQSGATKEEMSALAIAQQLRRIAEALEGLKYVSPTVTIKADTAADYTKRMKRALAQVEAWNQNLNAQIKKGLQG